MMSATLGPAPAGSLSDFGRWRAHVDENTPGMGKAPRWHPAYVSLPCTAAQTRQGSVLRLAGREAAGGHRLGRGMASGRHLQTQTQSRHSQVCGGRWNAGHMGQTGRAWRSSQGTGVSMPPLPAADPEAPVVSALVRETGGQQPVGLTAFPSAESREDICLPNGGRPGGPYVQLARPREGRLALPPRRS